MTSRFWTHLARRWGRAEPAPQPPSDEPALPTPRAVAGARYLLIVSREAAHDLPRLERRYARDPRVVVMRDRRQGDRRSATTEPEVERRQTTRRRTLDYWEDLRFHPVVLVPIPQSQSPMEADIMDATSVTDARQRVLDWAQEAQHIVGRVIPTIFEEHESLRRRVDEADRERERLARENASLREQLAEARAKHEALVGGQAEIVQSVGKFVSHMSQVLEPMRELADKLQQMPRG